MTTEILVLIEVLSDTLSLLLVGAYIIKCSLNGSLTKVDWGLFFITVGIISQLYTRVYYLATGIHPDNMDMHTFGVLLHLGILTYLLETLYIKFFPEKETLE